jgi:hypothetical protein
LKRLKDLFKLRPLTTMLIGIFAASTAGVVAFISGKPTAWNYRFLVLVGNICFISFSALVIIAALKLQAALAPWFPPQDPRRWEPSRTTLAQYSFRIRLFFTVGLAIPAWMTYHLARVQTPKIGLLFACVAWAVFGLYLVLKVWFTQIHLEPERIRIRNRLGRTRYESYTAVDRVETSDNRPLIRFSDGSDV